ncbi:MAG: hypothetical protein PWQ45_148 [Thermosipho sp. (in: thermotogales)]|nr:hypothetical protein [Thermosipho sp. (in: thermotogales)]
MKIYKTENGFYIFYDDTYERKLNYKSKQEFYKDIENKGIQLKHETEINHILSELEKDFKEKNRNKIFTQKNEKN